MKKSILLYLTALQTHGYIAAAAASCGVSSSTINSALRRLEQELGIMLYDPATRQLTAEGALYAQTAQAILNEDEALRRKLKVFQARTIRFACSDFVNRSFATQLSLKLLTRHENTRLQFAWKSPDGLLQGLLNDVQDIVFSCEETAPSGKLVYLPLLRSTMMLAVPPDHKVNPAQPMRSVADSKMISMFRGSRLYQQEMTLACRDGTPPEILIETNSYALADGLIQEKAGYAVVDGFAMTGDTLKQAALWPIPNSSITFGLWYPREKENLPLLQEVCALTRDVITEFCSGSKYVTILF